MAIEGDQCIDAGSEYCPCYLAEMNSCITCSRLSGKDHCTCSWRGVCIYQEYHFSNYKKKAMRPCQQATILERKKTRENMIIFTLKIPHTLARQLKQPGSYIFIRNQELEHYFDIPISIMESDDQLNQIRIAVEIHGVKTQSIKDVSDTLLIRGPYWNGLFGLDHLKKATKSNCLMIVRGIAQAPSILAIRYLLKNHNQVDVILDQGILQENLIETETEAGILEKSVDLYTPEGRNLIARHLEQKNYDLIFLAGSNYLQQQLIDHFNGFPGAKLVLTNNQEICCGEGICGACIVYDAGGIPLRSCKTQITKGGKSS